MIVSVGSVVDSDPLKPPVVWEDLAIDFVPFTESTASSPPAIRFSPLFQKSVLSSLIDLQEKGFDFFI
jgi:hypothetical protein